VRKLLGTVVVVLTMAILLPGAAHPQTVGACGWYLERNVITSTWVWDSWQYRWTTVDYEVDTYNDGCGNRQYASRVWVSDGTPAWLTADIRVWVCGGYQGTWSTGARWSNYDVVYSPVFHYWPWCGRQADNATSSSSSPYLAPNTSDYLTQG
jgi:hypothetical protein